VFGNALGVFPNRDISIVNWIFAVIRLFNVVIAGQSYSHVVINSIISITMYFILWYLISKVVILFSIVVIITVVVVVVAIVIVVMIILHTLNSCFFCCCSTPIVTGYRGH
jgi:hypothetical protein